MISLPKLDDQNYAEIVEAANGPISTSTTPALQL